MSSETGTFSCRKLPVPAFEEQSKCCYNTLAQRYLEWATREDGTCLFPISTKFGKEVQIVQRLDWCGCKMWWIAGELAEPKLPAECTLNWMQSYLKLEDAEAYLADLEIFRADPNMQGETVSYKTAEDEQRHKEALLRLTKDMGEPDLMDVDDQLAELPPLPSAGSATTPSLDPPAGDCFCPTKDLNFPPLLGDDEEAMLPPISPNPHF